MAYCTVLKMYTRLEQGCFPTKINVTTKKQQTETTEVPRRHVSISTQSLLN